MTPQSDARQKKADRPVCTSGEKLHGIWEGFQASPEPALWRWVTAGIGLAVLLTTFMSVLTWRSISRAGADADWVAHTRQVETVLQAALRSAVDIETGTRGFAATGEESFLDPYREGQRAVAQNLDTLRRLTADNSAQQKRLELLKSQVNATVEMARRSVDDRRQSGAVPPKADFFEGKRRMDALRVTVTEMMGEEDKLLNQRVQGAQAARSRARIITSGGTLAGAALLVLAGLSIRREISRSGRLRGQLRTLNADLEQRSAESRQAAEEAHESSRYARSLLEASLDPLVTISREGKITDVNEAAVKVTGMQRTHLIGTDFSNYFTEPEKAREGYRQVFEKGFVTNYPLTIRHKDERLVDVLYNASVYRDVQGDVLGVFAAARDITERKRAEEEVRKASLYARSLIEASLDPLVTISREGKITDVNRATETVTGISRERLIGSDFSDYFTQPQMARQGYEQVFAKGTVRDYPLAIRHNSGGITDVLYNATLFKNEDGEIEGIFAAARDITERKRAEEEVRRLNDELEQRVIRRTAQLEAANKELEAFTYSVSHDLRAPLRHISGFSKILTEEYGSSLAPEAQHHLQRIHEGTRRLGLLVDDLLNLAHVGRRDLGLQVTGLSSVVAEVVADLKPECEGRQVEWKIGSLPFVECDPALMKQVFQNLLSNAVKFTRPRPQAVIEVGQKDQEGTPVVFVRDNGVGFNMKYADKLFGVFQRLHRPEDFEGTGVGLATVRRIIQKHGGRIWAEAELDKGATFYFTLGASEKTEAKTKAAMAGDKA